MTPAKKKNIHVLHVAGNPAGGIRRHLHTILFGLPQENFTQSYAYSSVETDLGFKRDYTKLERLLCGRMLPLNILKRPALSDFVNLCRLAGFVRKNKVDIVHGHGAKGGAYARMLAGLCGIKAVYTPHGGAVHKMFGWAEDKLYTAAEKLFFGFTDYFLFESSYTAEAYFAKVGKKPKNWTINCNGIPFPDMAAVRRESQALGYAPGTGDIPNIGVFGILRPQKGQLYAVKAAAELVSRGIKVKLHLYGKGPDSPALESEVSKLGLAETAIFHGEVDNPEPHMFAMDIILIPSLFEAFGYVAIEAFSLRKAVVASSAGGLKEIITDGINGLLVRPGDHLSIVEAIEKLCTDVRLRQELAGKGSERFARDFTEERMVARIKEVYAGLAGF